MEYKPKFKIGDIVYSYAYDSYRQQRKCGECNGQGRFPVKVKKRIVFANCPRCYGNGKVETLVCKDKLIKSIISEIYIKKSISGELMYEYYTDNGTVQEGKLSSTKKEAKEKKKK